MQISRNMTLLSRNMTRLSSTKKSQEIQLPKRNLVVDPITTTLLRKWDTQGRPTKMILDGNSLIVAEAFKGVVSGLENSAVRIYDVTGTSTPPVVGTYESQTLSSAKDIKILGNTAYGIWGGVEENKYAFQIFSIENKAHPTYISHYDTSQLSEHANCDSAANASPLALDIMTQKNGDITACISFCNGLLSLDVSTQTIITKLSFYPTSAPCLGVTVNGTEVALFLGTTGVEIVDMSTPNKPTHILTYNSPGKALSGEIIGTRMLLCDDSRGMRILDRIRTKQLSEIGRYEDFPTDEALQSDHKGTLVAIATGHNQVNFMSTATPETPTYQGKYTYFPGNFEDVIMSTDGRKAYIADYTYNRILEIQINHNTNRPTTLPTARPSRLPTPTPTKEPTPRPSPEPISPTAMPLPVTWIPSMSPTTALTFLPSGQELVTERPSPQPFITTWIPSMSPTTALTSFPSVQEVPTEFPSPAPATTDSLSPTMSPSSLRGGNSNATETSTMAGISIIVGASTGLLFLMCILQKFYRMRTNTTNRWSAATPTPPTNPFVNWRDSSIDTSPEENESELTPQTDTP